MHATSGRQLLLRWHQNSFCSKSELMSPQQILNLKFNNTHFSTESQESIQYVFTKLKSSSIEPIQIKLLINYDFARLSTNYIPNLPNIKKNKKLTKNAYQIESTSLNDFNFSFRKITSWKTCFVNGCYCCCCDKLVIPMPFSKEIQIDQFSSQYSCSFENGNKINLIQT